MSIVQKHKKIPAKAPLNILLTRKSGVTGKNSGNALSNGKTNKSGPHPGPGCFFGIINDPIQEYQLNSGEKPWSNSKN
ncbi:hypothetical protein CRP01_20440 [Flavilitoribacter nigricans DSM 23189 = NBRC 102662]|uniref:Uncharacterized protein n=1 Tax=Flavilitoribacter nigricans (strain ATCC 23147 / DSM 23189 / NBRC 102662 / NCIMB 1420 / SS-2) TaxID=1122177 RepID=A0A2D0N918_FLAN2|nr:hypothetical protein CRP01_20440 [Flavilitoribacter nigricans DSM 23189 = NBRC 102662]